MNILKIFKPSLCDEHLGCFQFGVIMNIAAVHSLINYFWETWIHQSWDVSMSHIQPAVYFHIAWVLYSSSISINYVQNKLQACIIQHKNIANIL